MAASPTTTSASTTRRCRGHHSLIINILNDSFLEDLNSTNGTYVNGKLIKKHALQHGDVVTVGHHQLRFVEDDEAQDEFEKTMVIQPSSRPAAEKMRAAKDRGGKGLRGRFRERHAQGPRRQGAASRRPSCRCSPARSRAASSSSTRH